MLIAVSLLVPARAIWKSFRDLEREGLTMFGQMTAGSWSYIGGYPIVQHTYQTLTEAGRRRFGGSLSGQPIVAAGLVVIRGPEAIATAERHGLPVPMNEEGEC